MMSSDRQKAADEFRKYIDSLHGEYGLTQGITFQDGQFTTVHLAGIRVLEAIPIFDRDTGDVESWRYLLMFAEMGILDGLNAGHPTHVFECTVTGQKKVTCYLREVNGEYEFMLSTNDPHEIAPSGQAEIYKTWDAEVERVGGVSRLNEILDKEAERWLQGVRASREEQV